VLQITQLQSEQVEQVHHQLAMEAMAAIRHLIQLHPQVVEQVPVVQVAA
jgi:hypothetical protein